jgi:hypothetical protein
VPRRLNVTPDRIQSHGIDLSGVLKPSGTGLVWTAVEEGARIVAAAKADAEQQVTRAREELRGQVAALAVAGAEQILKREVNAAAHADLLSQLSTEL